MSTSDQAWERERDDVFNVVADIDPQSARIEYAFLAGYKAALDDSGEQTGPYVCPPCEAGDHPMCHYWGRHRWWAPCDCPDQGHTGLSRPVNPFTAARPAATAEQGGEG